MNSFDKECLCDFFFFLWGGGGGDVGVAGAGGE